MALSSRPISSVICSFCLLVPVGAQSQGLFEEAVAGEPAAEESPEIGPVSTLPSLELGGYARGGVFAGKRVGEDVAEVKAGYGELSLQARTRMTGVGDAFGELRLRAGSDFSDPTQLVELREAYVNLFGSFLDVRVGQQIIAWGRADGVNPTDLLTPRNMGTRSPNLDDRRLANLALRSNVYFGPLRLESVWIPVYQPSRFPPFELPGGLEMGPAENPDFDLANGTMAQRLHVEAGPVEASVSYIRGFAPFPGLAMRSFQIERPQLPPNLPPNAPPPTPEQLLASMPDTPPEIGVGFKAYRQQVVGADFATSLGAMGLRGEAALSWPDLASVDNAWVPLPDLHYVVGLDREVVTDVTVVVQYVGRYVIGWDGLESKLGGFGATGNEAVGPAALLEDLDDEERAAFVEAVMAGETPALLRDEMRVKTRMIHGQTVELSHSVAGAIRWSTLHSTLNVDIGGMYNLSTGEWMARPAATYQMADRLELSAGAEIFAGPEETMYGLMGELMSAAYVELKGHF